ncbi:MAG: hypothetical protein H0X44_01260 [Acidobacteria bacterium]|nr:hypothetical protein [Acidobacteriota bacterium]
MPARHHGFLFRLCAVALLLLALLPVTAPFSTLDLLDFFRDTPAETGSITQAKNASQKLASTPGLAIDLELSRPDIDRRRPASVRTHASRRPAVIPLRL